MELKHCLHLPGQGWVQALPAHLDSPDTWVLAFGGRSLQDSPAALQGLAAAFPQSVVMGCSSAGEIADRQVADGAVSVAVARFQATRLRRASTPLAEAGQSAAAGQRLAAQLPPAGLRAVFLLAGGLAVNGTELLQGLAAALPPGVAVSGGMAGDGSRFEKTWVLDEEGRPCEHRVTAVGLYGEQLRMGHGCSGGWTEFGPGRHITRSQGNVLYELDGQPALALYKHYLGQLAAELPGSALLFPLSLRTEAGSAPLVRTILAIDEATQSMTFAGDMPEGAVTQLMRTNVDRLVASAEDAAMQALHGLGSGPVLALSVSCIGRRLVMGERTEEEVEAVVDALPAGSAHAGFYSYGEFGPAMGCRTAELHNQTMTLTVFSEALA